MMPLRLLWTIIYHNSLSLTAKASKQFFILIQKQEGSEGSKKLQSRRASFDATAFEVSAYSILCEVGESLGSQLRRSRVCRVLSAVIGQHRTLLASPKEHQTADLPTTVSGSSDCKDLWEKVRGSGIDPAPWPTLRGPALPCVLTVLLGMWTPERLGVLFSQLFWPL